MTKKVYLLTACATSLTIGALSQVVQFTKSGTYTVPSNARKIQVLVVAGGGGGGCSWEGGGGGGGGVIYTALDVLGGEQFDVVVGAGGVGAVQDWAYAEYTYGSPPQSGENSAFGSLKAIGGGAGAYDLHNDAWENNVYGPAQDGGSGGGGGNPYPAGGNGISNQGYAGGSGGAGSGPFYGGGGGGAGGPGADLTGNLKGGDGFSTNITGTLQTYSGGGGGAYRIDASAVPYPYYQIFPGGLGGGGYGIGGYDSIYLNPSATYFGGGGGAVHGLKAGSGYQGIVVVKVLETIELTASIQSASIVHSLTSQYDSSGCLVQPPSSSVKTFLSLTVRVSNVGTQSFSIPYADLASINCGSALAYPNAFSISFNGEVYSKFEKCLVDTVDPLIFTTCNDMGLSSGNYHDSKLWVTVPEDALTVGSSYNVTVTVFPGLTSVGSTSLPFSVKY